MTLMDMRGFSREGLKALHPGGSLGLRLTSVGEIMHGPSRMPLVDEFAPMKDVVVTMTSRGFGIAGVIDAAGRLIGVITDGDLRRHFDELATTTARDVMTSHPKTVASDAFAEEALHFLNENKITCAFVMDRNSPVNCEVPVGIIHVHDFLRVGLG
jgi:arabinose-5-phosphate isomerase